MFRDRIEAGLLLAAKLKKYKNDAGVVLAVPRGGVPVAYSVAMELGLPHADVSDQYVGRELEHIRARLREMYKRFMGDKEPESLEGKTVIVIDDGIATGNTILGTVNVLRKSKPAKIVIGVPVASQSAVQKLSKEVDEVVAVLIPDEFYGVGAFYEDFDQVSDEEVMFYLDKLRELRKAG